MFVSEGNNGEVTEGDPLFENNILLPTSSTKKLPEVEETQNAENIDSKDSQKYKFLFLCFSSLTKQNHKQCFT